MVFRSCPHSGGNYHGVNGPCPVCDYQEKRPYVTPEVTERGPCKEIVFKIRIVDKHGLYRVETEDKGRVSVGEKWFYVDDLQTSLETFLDEWFQDNCFFEMESF